MANDLAALLRAVAALQQSESFIGGPLDAVRAFPLDALKSAAHQHAEALRGIIEQLSDSMDADATVDEQLEAAAAFLEGTDA